jgi:hypothetical protein
MIDGKQLKQFTLVVRSVYHGARARTLEVNPGSKTFGPLHCAVKNSKDDSRIALINVCYHIR